MTIHDHLVTILFTGRRYTKIIKYFTYLCDHLGNMSSLFTMKHVFAFTMTYFFIGIYNNKPFFNMACLIFSEKLCIISDDLYYKILNQLDKQCTY